MSASQISFLEFALTGQALCTPSVVLPAAVAAPCAALDGGECIDASTALDTAFEIRERHGSASNGFWVLVALSNAQGGVYGRLSNSSRVAALDALVSEANHCIQFGC